MPRPAIRAIGRFASKAGGRKAERDVEGEELTVGEKDADSYKTARAAPGRQKSRACGPMAKENIQEWDP
jgi:hypothetical protein